MKRVLLLFIYMTSSIAFAVSDADVQKIQESVEEHDVYITKNGSEMNVLIPVSSVFEAETTYYQKKSKALLGEISKVLDVCDGRVHMQGIVRHNDMDESVHVSALYMQVKALSDLFFKQHTGISYAPITMKSYEKNDKYGIWRIYPEHERFIQLTVNID